MKERRVMHMGAETCNGHMQHEQQWIYKTSIKYIHVIKTVCYLDILLHTRPIIISFDNSHARRQQTCNLGTSCNGTFCLETGPRFASCLFVCLFVCMFVCFSYTWCILHLSFAHISVLYCIVLYCIIVFIVIYCIVCIVLRGHNWVHSAHGPYYTVTLNSNFAISKIRNCFQLGLEYKRIIWAYI